MVDSIIQGDCLQVMATMPDECVDMILCDLPYGTTQCSWDAIIPFEPLWAAYKRIIKPNGAIVLTASQPFTTKLIASNMEMFKYCWVWEKERPTNIFQMKKRPGKVHEDIVIFYNEHPIYNPITTEAKQPKNNNRLKNKSQLGIMNKLEIYGNTNTVISKDYDSAIRQPRSVLRVNRGTRSSRKIHPTQKPVALFEYLIRTYTNEGEVVLDNCIGSGTTAIACIRSSRHYIGVELEQKYVDIANERIRIEQIQLQLAL